MRLIYFNNSALGKNGEVHPFLAQERDWLTAHFDRVEVVSYHGVLELSADDREEKPPVRHGLAALRAALAAPFSRDLRHELGRLWRAGRLSATGALKLLAFTARGLKLHYWAEGLLRGAGDEPVTLYAFWMSYDGYAAALCKRRCPSARFVARGHAYDIDVERNPMNPFLMKRAIVDASDGVYLISRSVREQLMSYLRGQADESKVQVLAMGSGGAPVPLSQPPCLDGGVLHVVSCARVIAIKQVPVLAQALAGWEGAPVRWTHIGGGEGLEELRALCEETLDRKPNVIWELTGDMPADEARAYCERHPCDIFINTSRREGVPVSIMEAMRCGVPFIAPDVGGLPEMAGEGAGYLFDPADGAAGVRAALARFATLSAQGMQAMRRAAKARWDEHYQSGRLLGRLFPETVKEDDA